MCCARRVSCGRKTWGVVSSGIQLRVWAGLPFVLGQGSLSSKKTKKIVSERVCSVGMREHKWTPGVVMSFIVVFCGGTGGREERRDAKTSPCLIVLERRRRLFWRRDHLSPANISVFILTAWACLLSAVQSVIVMKRPRVRLSSASNREKQPLPAKFVLHPAARSFSSLFSHFPRPREADRLFSQGDKMKRTVAQKKKIQLHAVIHFCVL